MRIRKMARVLLRLVEGLHKACLQHSTGEIGDACDPPETSAPKGKFITYVDREKITGEKE